LRRHAPFFVILAGYFIVAGLFAIRVPDWQAPDEPAHYNVVRQIAGRGCCPLIEQGDWDNPYLEQIKAADFAPELLSALPAIQYEDHQPPLYYMLLAPVYALTNGSLTALRLASVVIGAGVVIAAYAVSLRAFRGQYGVAWGAAAFVAFLPQHVHILASVNNDALAWALVGAILWASIDYADGGRTPAWALGLLVGAALLTKSTAYLMGGVALAAVWMRTERFSLRPFVSYLVPAAVLGLLWWLRNIAVYGFPDFLGLREHDAVVIGQTRTAEYIAEFGTAKYIADAVQTTVTSFYGQFGWMAIPLWSVSPWIQAALVGVTLLGLAGAVFRSFAGQSEIRASRGTWTLFGLTALLSILMVIYYNTSFVQFQGRYAYPLLIPLAVTVALGLDFIRKRLPIARNLPWLTAAALSLVAVLDVWLLWRVIVPNLTS
jgi:4-amino-4-deoxy-L-arabinose transferase-like glycosyltransferase